MGITTSKDGNSQNRHVVDAKSVTKSQSKVEIDSKLWRAEHLQTKSELGRGPNGYVMEATNIKTNDRCAIKIFEYNSREDSSYKYAIEKARKAYRVNKLGVPGVAITYVCETIEVENNFSLKHKFALIMELFEQNFADLIVEMKASDTIFGESQLLRYALDLTQALAAAHNQGMFHLNIKDENIFLTQDRQRLKIGDFDLPNNEARKISTKNAMFFPPELSGLKYNCNSVQWDKVDSYGIGIILLKSAMLRESISLEEGRNLEDMIAEVESAYGKRLSMYIKRLTAKNPEERWSAERLFKILQENYMVDGISSEEMDSMLSPEQEHARSMIEKGVHLRKDDDHRAALQILTEARDKLVCFTNLNQYDRRLAATCLHNLALCHYDLKDYLQSLKHHLICLDLKKKYLRAMDIWTSLGNIGKVYNKLGNLQKSLIYYIKAYQAAHQGGDSKQMNVAKALDNIASTYDTLGDYENSLQCHFQCLEIVKKQFGETNSRYGKSLRNIARTFRNLGRLKDSKTFELMAKQINY